MALLLFEMTPEVTTQILIVTVYSLYDYYVLLTTIDYHFSLPTIGYISCFTCL